MMGVPGTYALLLHVDRSRTIIVGALGEVTFPSGWYVYVGSAHGPGGLEARLARHRRRVDKRFHWHIDYLRAVANLTEIWLSASQARQECDWAEAAAMLREASVVVPRFGASDCRCATHLFHYPQRPELTAFKSQIRVELERLMVNDGHVCE
jgi:Uri superfamily endonuclease